MLVCAVVGARPNFMKIAPIVRELERRRIPRLLVHTGQHYDANMSAVFFQDLELPPSDVSLGVGSGTHARQTAGVMVAFEDVCLRHRPDLVLVGGDVNSTLGAALAAAKLTVPVAHVEAGLRSDDRSMPEELNRILTDHLAELLFTTEASANQNLEREGISAHRIHFVGNCMVDSLLRHAALARDRSPWRAFELEEGGYALVTLHRPENVEDPLILAALVEAINGVSQRLPVLFPVHPRTRQRLRAAGRPAARRVRFCGPLPYLTFVGLLGGARCVLTDSGGIQEETTALGVPCLTLRANTERPVTVALGTNRLVARDPEKIWESVGLIMDGRWPTGTRPPLWDGQAAPRIVDAIERWASRPADALPASPEGLALPGPPGSRDAPTEDRLTVGVVGLGYVGLPLAVRFGLAGVRVIGYDVNAQKVGELQRGIERMGEVDTDDLRRSRLLLTPDPGALAEANFIIIAVPTPITPAKQPDLGAVEAAGRVVGTHLRPGGIVVLESTVYPGVTEEVLGPIIAQASGLAAGEGFFLAYSPERANPGDREHSVDKVVKVVAAQDPDTLDRVAAVYGRICRAGIYRAPTIKTAEAAKVIENIQRDLNIALANELSLIFHRVGLNVQDVLEAAGTKWNFHRYRPGLVGGHCIGVDPYYLTYLAERVGYHPEVILAGRRVNDSMADYVTELTIRALIEAGKTVHQARVIILGATFKENVNDTRNSKVKDLIQGLRRYRIDVLAHDPLLADEEIRDGFRVENARNLGETGRVDAVVLAVPHDAFRALTVEELRGLMTDPPVLVDVKGIFARRAAEEAGFVYKTL